MKNMDKKLDTHINLNKEEAYELLEKGYKIRHEFYEPEEFIYMKMDIIFDEKGHIIGRKDEKSSKRIMNYEKGWSTANSV